MEYLGKNIIELVYLVKLILVWGYNEDIFRYVGF